MNMKELKARLKKEGFNENVYSFGESLPSYEGLILKHSNSRWRIQHFERGVQRELESYLDERQACKRMYELLLNNFR